MQTKPSATIIFALSELDREIIDALPFISSSSRLHAINSVRHLNRSWKLKEIDKPMAIFRAITAEEEAATALFKSLQRLKYRGVDKLKPYQHIQKNAVIPFWDAITRVTAKVGNQMPKTELFFELDNKRLVTRFKHKHPQTNEAIWAYPIPPLNFSISGGPVNGKMKKEDFSEGVKDIVAGANVKDIIDYIRDRADLRNRLLYASPTGCPDVLGDIEKSLKIYQRHVFIILRMYMLIEPYPSDQLFVQQALEAFLKTLRLLPKDIDVGRN